MSVFHVAAGSILVTTGLLLASVIIAAEGTQPAPTAQMNRSSYDERSVPLPTAQMNRSSYAERSAPVPTAQMNRGLYKVSRGGSVYVPANAANHPAPRRPAHAVTQRALAGLE